jgi:pimeloyl-ACP methyl ester carboxylesterase
MFLLFKRRSCRQLPLSKNTSLNNSISRPVPFIQNFPPPKSNFMFTGKKILSGILLTAITMFTISQNANAQKSNGGVKNIVLVHGAFADGSSWAKVIPQLQAKGMNVIAVQNPLTSLSDDVAATKRVIASMEGPVLLVGHSYGGMVITEAGNDPKVAGLLYVCSLVPNDNQSVVDVTAAFPPAPGSGEFQVDATSFITLSTKGIHQYFAQDLNASDRNVVFATQVPWATKATTEKITKAAWKTKPSWFVIGTEDYMVPLELARAEAKMINATVLELKSSHVPMVSQPDKVASFISVAAKKL